MPNPTVIFAENDIQYPMDFSNRDQCANFSPGKAATTNGIDTAFTDLATTAWANTRSSSPTDPIYYAQPEVAVLYNEIEVLVSRSTDVGSNDISDDLLEYMEVPSAKPHCPTHIMTGHQIMGQRITLIAMVVMPIHILKQTAYGLT